MAKGYWVAHVDVDDLETYKKYIAANAVPFAEFGARFLVRGGPHEVREGNVRQRTIVLEFESYEKARACYDSASYQEVKAIRDAASRGDMVIVEGYDG
ncbi:DUF1330 domain-containing protein [Primorskyibacter sp. S87]|uniref:DUF1330 domain-containing protein n=1 Tax=Primorskyibacter sp. S87 TaxID=3415126 RepID=UPI003C7DE2F1